MAATLAGYLLVTLDGVVVAIESRSTDFCMCIVFYTNAHCTPGDGVVVYYDLGTFTDGNTLVNKIGNDIVFYQNIATAFTDINCIGTRADSAIHSVSAENSGFNVVCIDAIDFVILIRAVDSVVIHLHGAFFELEYIDVGMSEVVTIVNQAAPELGM